MTTKVKVQKKTKKAPTKAKKKPEVFQPESLLIHLKNKNQKKIFEALCEALKIDFEFKKEHIQEQESPYDPEFVKKILKGEKAMKAGKKGLKINVDNLWK